MQFAVEGAPIRAAYGPLPGALQTAGRAERRTLLMAARLFGPSLECAFEDLLALAEEAPPLGARARGRRRRSCDGAA